MRVMAQIKSPVDDERAPARALAAGACLEPVRPACREAVFDFRSSRFVADAQALAHATGCPLELCRRELFIAEGDLSEACQVLVAGYAAPPRSGALH